MRFQGHNVLAILVAAIAIYAVGFVIYGLVFEQAWIAASGYTREEVETGMSKMPFSPIMPILIAIGLSLVIKWRNKPGLMSGVVTGLLMAALFLFPERLYAYVYSPVGGATLLGIDTLHIFVTGVVGGGVLGAWK